MREKAVSRVFFLKNRYGQSSRHILEAFTMNKPLQGKMFAKTAQY